MTDADRSGSDDRTLTRRQILGGMVGAGSLGVVGGVGTRALLTDEETVSGDILGNPYSGGEVDLSVACLDDDAACEEAGQNVSFQFQGIDPPAKDVTQLCLTVADVPADVWLRTPDPIVSDLADTLRVTLSYGDGTVVTDPDGSDVENRTLNSVLSAFERGGHLDVFEPGEQVCLWVGWALDDEDSVYGESVGLTLDFAAVQHQADATPPNPWQG